MILTSMSPKKRPTAAERKALTERNRSVPVAPMQSPVLNGKLTEESLIQTYNNAFFKGTIKGLEMALASLEFLKGSGAITAKEQISGLLSEVISDGKV